MTSLRVLTALQWTELDRILQEDTEEHASGTPNPFLQPVKQPQTPWPDVWKVYEDVCVICAGLWMGPWRESVAAPDRMENWGNVRPNGEDDAGSGTPTSSPPGSYVRNVGMGIEGRPAAGVGEHGELRDRTRKRHSSGSSLLWSWASGRGTPDSRQPSSPYKDVDHPDAGEDDLVLVHDAHERRAATTLALLRVFHRNTAVLLARFADILPQRSAHSHNLVNAGAGAPIVLTPKDLMSFDLGPLNGLDGHFVEWVAEEYGGGVHVVVRRGWRDIVALFFGLG